MTNGKEIIHTIVFLLKTTKPNTRLNPSNENNTVEVLRPTFAFLIVSLATCSSVDLSVLLHACTIPLVVLTSIDEKALSRDRMKILN